MIESIFYFQIFLALLLLIIAFWKKSAAFFMIAGVFFLMTAFQLAAEGVDYFNGWRTVGLDSDLDDVNTTAVYDTETIETSSSLNMWYWAFFASGFVWLIFGLILSVTTGRRSNEVV